MIERYIEQTKDLRKDEDQLIISYAEPHAKVKSSTIAKYVLDILAGAGINTSTFKAHSVRGAATSKAKASLSLKEISNAAGWSQGPLARTFARVYDRPIVKNMGSELLKASFK